MEKPLNKPKKELSLLQKRLMKTHKIHHTKSHLDKMKTLMKAMNGDTASHRLAMKKVGK